MTGLPALYPLKFYPILKEKVWGGSKLKNILNKKGTDSTGESWELSGVAENISVVSNGSHKGMLLSQLMETHKEALVGTKVYKIFGNTFPLLFKFIDAEENLSVQLHPGDDLARERHNSFGKSEMWYIMDTDENAKLILGFNELMDRSTYLKHLSANKLIGILNSETVAEGDAFFIGPGLVHAIGSGVMLAEIQQTSDITYRIYDWDRPDSNGDLRDLHTDLALEAINFEQTRPRLDYLEIENEPSLVCKTPFFEVNKLKLNKKLERNLQSHSSFTVYMCVEGSAVFETDDFSEKLVKGETILIPAIIPNITIESENASFLEIYVP